MFSKQPGFNMGGTVLFLLSALAVAHADVEGFYDNGCPKDTSIAKLLPHAICEQYYQCSNGKLIARYCPAGLHFNPVLEKCDWLSDGKTKCHKKRDDSNYTEYPQELDSGNPQHAVSICKNNQSTDILIAHENCNEFFKCSYGKPIALKCAQNLLFNIVNKKCDWPQNVQCGERVIPFHEINYALLKRDSNVLTDETDSSNSDPSQAVTICATPGSDGVLVAHEYCNLFYKCFSGKPVTMKCPLKLLYNSYKLYCDWPRNVDCNERVLPDYDNDTSCDDKSNESDENDISSGDHDNSDPSQAPLICAGINSDGNLVAHENCNQYYKCAGGHPVALFCSDNLLFNPSKNYCDWPNNVDCDDRNVIDDNSSENDTDDSDNETTTLRSQPESNNDPNEAPAICKAEGSDGVLVAHENCNQFYKCYNSHPVELTCPGNLLYNPSKEYCDWPTQVECRERVIPEKTDDSDNSNNGNESGNNNNGNESSNNNNGNNDNSNGSSGIYSDPSHARAICATDNSDGILIAHENCNQFYKCFEKRPVALFCQINLVFNPLKGYCDWPRNVDCGDRIIPGESTTEDTSISSACSSDPNANVVAHENCNQFYKCLNGRTYPMNCPPGLYFNTVLKVCDWPMNVDCGDRLTESQILVKEQARNG